jgi:hypothetical protein
VPKSFWWNPWLALSLQSAWMCWEAQSVITLRLLRLAKGGAAAEAEVQRMFAEKAAALAEAQIAATTRTLRGGRSHQVTKETLSVYSRRVRRNRRRLTK